MIIRALDTNGDWTFGLGKQNYLFNQKAIMLNISTRLYEFVNDSFWNQNAGIDWARLLGTPGTQTELTLTVRSVVLQSFGVTAINSISSIYDEDTRNLVISMNINTIFTSNFGVQLALNLEQFIGG